MYEREVPHYAVRGQRFLVRSYIEYDASKGSGETYGAFEDV